MAMDPNAIIDQKGTPDELDRVIYALMPDRYGHCDRQRSHNRTFRNNRREEIIKAVKKLLDASNAGTAQKV